MSKGFDKWLGDFVESDEYKADTFLWRDMARSAFEAGRTALPSPDYQSGQEDEKEGAMAFACYLLDNHEREEITEERLQQWCSDFIRALPAQQEVVDLASVAPVTTFAEYAKSKEGELVCGLCANHKIAWCKVLDGYKHIQSKICAKYAPRGQQESVCEWKPSESGSARYQTGCGKSVISTGQEDGDECCCCFRPIRLGGGELDSDVATAVKAGINGTGNDGY